MDKSKRNTIISLAIVGLISVGVLVGFSIPLGIFPFFVSRLLLK